MTPGYSIQSSNILKQLEFEIFAHSIVNILYSLR